MTSWLGKSLNGESGILDGLYFARAGRFWGRLGWVYWDLWDMKRPWKASGRGSELGCVLN